MPAVFLYGYLAGGHGTGSTTPLVQTISQNGMTLTYTYDDAGNITSVSDGSKTVSYVYDLLGQLIRANDPYDTTAGDSGTTWVYSYDQGGNILSRAAYAFTTDAVGTAVQTNRYVYDSNASWGLFGMFGDGVFEVGPRELFIDDQLRHGKAVTSFELEVTDEDTEALKQYFNNIMVLHEKSWKARVEEKNLTRAKKKTSSR